jgi:hypothetical protein
VPKIVVICPGNVINHVPFDSDADAEEWIEYGHFCLANHHHHVITIQDHEVAALRQFQMAMMVVDILLPKEFKR